MAAAAAISSTGIKRTQPLVKQLFRNVVLHRPAPEKELIVDGVPQMVILLPWLGAKEKIAHKYIHNWKEHGFSVMHVTTNVQDLLMPHTYSEVTVKRMMEYILNSDHRNIIHGISVGSYVATRLVMHSLREQVNTRISHQIFDSYTSISGLPDGVKHAVTNPFLSSIASAIGKAYYKYADLSILNDTNAFLINSPATIPTYYMHSQADRVAQYKNIVHWIQAQSKISPTSLLLLPEIKKVPHVNILRYLGERTYMSCIFKFLGRNKFNVQTEFAINEETSELSAMETTFVQ